VSGRRTLSSVPVTLQKVKRRGEAASLGGRTERTRKEVSALFALTDSAVQAVTHIVASSEADSDTGGLRLAAAQTGDETNLELSVVSMPAEDDEVIEEQGARVFLEQEAASLLDDKVLDAGIEQNRVAFTIADQA